MKRKQNKVEAHEGQASTASYQEQKNHGPFQEKINHFLVSFLCFHSKAITITFPHKVLFLYFLDPGILTAPSWLVIPQSQEIAIEGRGKTLYCLATGRFVVPNTPCKKKINVFSKS